MIKYPETQALIPFSQIWIDTERRIIDDDHVRALAEELDMNGLTHLPTVLDLTTPGSYPEIREYYKIPLEEPWYFLIAGAHRTMAMGNYLEMTSIPCSVHSGEFLPSQKMQLEYTENNLRLEENWKEKCLGMRRIHLQLVKENREKESKRWTARMTGDMFNVSKASVSMALSVAEALLDPKSPLHICDGIASAYNYILTAAKDELASELARRQRESKTATMAAVLTPKTLIETRAEETGHTPAAYVEKIGTKQPTPPSGKFYDKTIHRPDLGLFNEDCRDTLARLQSERFDGIFTDPMYGVDGANISVRNHTFINKFKKFQEDGKAFGEIKLLVECIPEFYRILKPNAWFCFFYDLEHHEKLQEICASAGFTVQRWPHIWLKTHACRNDAARFNSTKNYEPVMICRKGNAVLREALPRSIYPSSRNECDFVKANVDHPFVKPYKAWEDIIKPRALEGSTFYEPFAGRGSLLNYAYANNHQVVASELDPIHFAYLCSNVEKWQTPVTSTPTPGVMTTDSSL